MGSTPCDLHVAIPERQHVRLQRGTRCGERCFDSAQKDMPCNKREPMATWSSLSGSNPSLVANRIHSSNLISSNPTVLGQQFGII